MYNDYKHLPWPLNLWSAVFRRDVSFDELQEDWERTLESVLSTLGAPRRKEGIIYFFREGMSLQEIGNIYGTTSGAVMQQIGKDVRELQHPTRIIFLQHALKAGQFAIDEKSIDSLRLSLRAWNALRRAGIETVEQLTERTERDISKLHNVGKTILQDIKERLADRGLSLRSEDACGMNERKRVCCNCGNNKRIKDEQGMVVRCECAVHGHNIGYLECFEGWCPHWKRDRTWDGRAEPAE